MLQYHNCIYNVKSGLHIVSAYGLQHLGLHKLKESLLRRNFLEIFPEKLSSYATTD